MDEMVKYLKALTFLQLQAVTGGSAYQKPELLLERAGFKHKEIADMLGKTAVAVAKTLSRAKSAARSDTNE
jgi:DNA-directed RNA polymerase specialized sigma24 family protein